MMRSRYVVGLTLVALALACAGDQGPMGPAGPQGEEGPPGPEGPAGAGFVVVAGSGRLNADGEGAILFEDASIETSIVNCWVSDAPDGPWLKVAFESNGSSSLSCGASNSGDDLLVGFVGFPGGWYALATVATPTS